MKASCAHSVYIYAYVNPRLFHCTSSAHDVPFHYFQPPPRAESEALVLPLPLIFLSHFAFFSLSSRPPPHSGPHTDAPENHKTGRCSYRHCTPRWVAGVFTHTQLFGLPPSPPITRPPGKAAHRAAHRAAHQTLTRENPQGSRTPALFSIYSSTRLTLFRSVAPPPSQQHLAFFPLVVELFDYSDLVSPRCSLISPFFIFRP